MIKNKYLNSNPYQFSDKAYDLMPADDDVGAHNHSVKHRNTKRTRSVRQANTREKKLLTGEDLKKLLEHLWQAYQNTQVNWLNTRSLNNIVRKYFSTSGQDAQETVKELIDKNYIFQDKSEKEHKNYLTAALRKAIGDFAESTVQGKGGNEFPSGDFEESMIHGSVDFVGLPERVENSEIFRPSQIFAKA